MEVISLDQLSRTVQKFLENSPMFVLGSGASAQYGLPTMSTLAKAIASDEEIMNADDVGNLIERLTDEDNNLEAVINESNVGSKSLNRIRQVIWNQISAKDAAFFEKALPLDDMPLEIALKKVLSVAGNKTCIVTTNYDHLAEIAIDKVGAACVDGYFGHIFRKMDTGSSSTRLLVTRRIPKIVCLWKVHGSLDWFRSPDGTIFSIPFYSKIPQNCEPLIVPPSKEKYSETSQDPYREIISKADNAFEEARSFLCVGYGFGDEHIHPRLKEGAIQGKPIVILARTLTENCSKWLCEAKLKQFIALERAVEDENTTHVLMNDNWDDRSEFTIEGKYWDFGELVKIW